MFKKLLVMLLVMTLISSVMTVPSSYANTRTVTSTENSVRIRSSVDTSSNNNVLGYADRGDSYPYVSTTSDSIGRNWYEITFGGKKAFIIAEYATLSAEDVPAVEEEETKTGRVNSTVGLNVRSTASTSGRVLGVLANNSKVHYREIQGDWLRIDYKGQTGYVFKEHVILGENSAAPQPDAKIYYATTTLGVVMRRDAEAGSAVLANVPANTRLGYTEVKNGWYHVIYNNQRGWMSGNVLKLEGEKLPVIKPIETPAVKGDGIAVATVKSSGGLLVRSEAKVGDNRLGVLSNGTKLDVYEIMSGWHKIRYDGGFAYVSGNLLSVSYNTPKEDQISSDITHFVGVVHSAGVLVRSSANSTADNIIGALGHAQEIEVTEVVDDWYVFQYKGQKAYTSMHHVARLRDLTKPGSPAPDNSFDKYSGIVNTSSLNVRTGPSTSTRSLGLITKGTEVVIQGVSGDWYLITYSGQKAFVHSDYITRKSDLVASDKATAITVSLMPESTSGYVNELKRLTLTAAGSEFPEFKISHLQQGQWKEVRAYSPENSFSFKPTTVGEHKLRIHARSQFNPEEVTRDLVLQIKPRNVTTLNISVPELFVNYGNSLHLDSEGSPDPRYQVRVKKDGGEWQTIQSFSEAETVTFNPKSTGTYTIEVQAKDANASATQKVESRSVTVLPRKVTELRVTRFPESGAIKREEPLTLQGFTKGSPEAHYRFRVNGQVLQDYSKNDYYLWIPTTAGAYTVVIDAKDPVEGSVVSKTLTVNVSNEVGSAHYFTIDMLPSTVEEFAKRQMTSSSPQNQDAASGWRWRNATMAEVLKEVDPLKILGFDYTKEVSDVIGSITVTVNGYNVRSSNSTSSISLGTLTRGDTFDALEMRDGWYKVNYKGRMAWIYSDGVSFTSAATNYYPVGKAIKIQPGISLRLRSAAGTHGTILTTIQAGNNNVYTVRDEANGWYLINHSGTDGWISGEYVNSVTREMPSEWFQFLDLRQHTGASAEELNNTVLANKGILSGHADAFIQASKTYKVNEVYLIAHALLETGNGTSRLAKGMQVNGVTVYNMYGIGAYDSDPLGGGSRTAYEQGWTTPEKAIIGGAEWIGKRYVNNETHHQNTLWKMRWNFNTISHQYATDVGWARKQTYQMKNMYEDLQRYSFRFIIPQFLPM